VTYEEAYIKRLIFRSKQRGWLEVDLLMGAYATKFLAGKTKEELTIYEQQRVWSAVRGGARNCSGSFLHHDSKLLRLFARTSMGAMVCHAAFARELADARPSCLKDCGSRVHICAGK
jgi:hypothetical protein